MPESRIPLRRKCPGRCHRFEDQKRGGISYQIRPASTLNGTQTLDEITDFLSVHKDRDVLIYSSGDAEVVRRFREYGNERVSAVLEHLMAQIAVRGTCLGMKEKAH